MSEYVTLPVRTGSEAQSTFYTTGNGSLPGVKRPGRGFDHPPPASAEVKKEYSCTSTPPLGLRGLLRGKLYLYLYLILFFNALLLLLLLLLLLFAAIELSLGGSSPYTSNK